MEEACSFQLLKRIWEIRSLIPFFSPWKNLLIRKRSRFGFYYSTLPETAETFEVKLTRCNFLPGEVLGTFVAWQCNELKKRRKINLLFNTQPTASPAFNITTTEFDLAVRPSAAKHFHITKGDVFISWLLFFFPSAQFYVCVWFLFFFPPPDFNLLSSSGRSQVLSCIAAYGAGQ